VGTNGLVTTCVFSACAKCVSAARDVYSQKNVFSNPYVFIFCLYQGLASGLQLQVPIHENGKAMAQSKNKLTKQQQEELIQTLKARFEKHANRHKGIAWTDVGSRLEAQPEKLWSLYEMEQTGGEPDVVGQDEATGELLFFDCAPESPTGRRSLCYDREGWESRKEHRPENTAVDLAEEMGIELLSESQYRHLQTLGAFDTKTSSWLSTPAEIRKLGGSIFGDRRYNQVFVYHNGAQSYYAGRAFRGCLRV